MASMAHQLNKLIHEAHEGLNSVQGLARPIRPSKVHMEQLCLFCPGEKLRQLC